MAVNVNCCGVGVHDVMVIARYYRSLVNQRTLTPPWPMTEIEHKRYRAWQRMQRRMRALDKLHTQLRMLLVKRYYADIAEINANVTDTER